MFFANALFLIVLYRILDLTRFALARYRASRVYNGIYIYIIDICVCITIRHTLPFSLCYSLRDESLPRRHARTHARTHTQSRLYFIHSLIYLSFPRNRRFIDITLVKFSFFSFSSFFFSFGVIERNAYPRLRDDRRYVDARATATNPPHKL